MTLLIVGCRILQSYPEPAVQWVEGRDKAGKRRIAVVTGVNFGGIGYYIATGLLELDYHVVMVDCHPKEHMQEVSESLLIESKHKGAVDYIQADLLDWDSLKQLAQELKGSCPVIDILVNNAGGVPIGVTPDGFRKTFFLDYVAQFYLTYHLLENVSRSSWGRIITTSSSASGMKTDINQVMESIKPHSDAAEKIKDPLYWYSRAKFCINLMTTHLQQMLDSKRSAGSSSRIMVNCFHPGVVASRIWVSSIPGLKPIVKIFDYVALLSMRSPKNGARTALVLAAAQPDNIQISGQWWFNNKPHIPIVAGRDPVLAAALWKWSEELIRDH